jgi:hypothetical protein
LGNRVLTLFENRVLTLFQNLLTLRSSVAVRKTIQAQRRAHEVQPRVFLYVSTTPGTMGSYHHLFFLFFVFAFFLETLDEMVAPPVVHHVFYTPRGIEFGNMLPKYFAGFVEEHTVHLPLQVPFFSFSFFLFFFRPFGFCCYCRRCNTTND